jgi:outer membrane lipoprotein-sorting protein
MTSSFLIDAPIAKSTVNISIKQMTFPAGFENAFKFSIPQSAKIIEL